MNILVNSKKVTQHWEELFVVKHKSKYSCENAIYFNLGSEIIKENLIFGILF